jgi:hypothetical protein
LLVWSIGINSPLIETGGKGLPAHHRFRSDRLSKFGGVASLREVGLQPLLDTLSGKRYRTYNQQPTNTSGCRTGQIP